MINHTKLVKRQKQFLSVIGLTVPQFDSLSKEIQKSYKTTETKRLSKNREKKNWCRDTTLIIASKIGF